MQADVVCAECGRRLAPEEAALTVACPDCGARLPDSDGLPDDDTTSFWSPPGELVRPPAQADEPPTAAELEPPLVEARLSSSVTSPGDSSVLSELLTKPAGAVSAEESSGAFLANLAAGIAAPASISETAPLDDRPTEPWDASGSAEDCPTEPMAGSSVSASGARPAASTKAAETRSSSPLSFSLLFSYASAVTLVCAYLIYLLLTRHSTADLPDLAPPVKKGTRVTTLLYVPSEQQLPSSNVLKLGESRRFGSLLMTPTHVTRGPIAFTFFNPEGAETRPNSETVLKLHLRFENVSSDQEFTPLDRHLVFTKEADRHEIGLFKTNNFVCEASQRAARDKQVLVYDLSPDSPWSVVGQNLDHEFKPGEIYETFIPTTEEGWSDLQGDLLWRVHFRKGYNPDSFRGVTTLVEVVFQSSDIQNEAAPSTAGTDA